MHGAVPPFSTSHYGVILKDGDQFTFRFWRLPFIVINLLLCLTTLSARNMRATVNDKLGEMWKEAFVTCFSVLFHNFPVETDKNQEKYKGRESQGDLLNMKKPCTCKLQCVHTKMNKQSI
jgi:hypothetical protein